MDKATSAGREWFDALLPEDPEVTRRPMFGNLAGFVNGNMFLCLLGDLIAVRLPEQARHELAGLGGSAFEPMPGRPMKEYVVLPGPWRGSAEAEDWVERSLDYVRVMSPKVPKPRKAKTTAD